MSTKDLARSGISLMLDKLSKNASGIELSLDPVQSFKLDSAQDNNLRGAEVKHNQI